MACRRNEPDLFLNLLLTYAHFCQPSREAAKECSPRRKSWEARETREQAPKGRKKRARSKYVNCSAASAGRNLRSKEKSQIDFSTWLLLMPATTYSPTHFRVQYNRPSGA